MTLDEARAKFRETEQIYQSACLQSEGVRKFYIAALLTNDQVHAIKYQDQMHAVLDVQLDALSIMYSIRRQYPNL